MQRRSTLFINTVLPVCVFLAFTLLIVLFVQRYGFDWPRWDDFLLIDYYNNIFKFRTFTIRDFFTLRDGVHPSGTVALLSAVIFRLTGTSFMTIVWLNFFIIFGAAALTAATASRYLERPLSKALVWISVPAAMLHPFQVEQFFLPSSIGWFLTSCFILLNINIIERAGRFTIHLLLLTLFISTFSSAQGCILWAAAALHLVLRGGKRSLLWSIIFGTVAISSCIVLALLPPTHLACTSLVTYSPFSSIKDFWIYIVALISFFVGTLGTAFSDRDLTTLLSLGTATLVMVGVALLYVLRKRKMTPVKRMGLTLMFVGLLSLGMFAVGRISCGLHWAVFQFHMSPLMVILLAGLMLIFVQLFDELGKTQYAIQALVLIPFIYLFVGIVVSFPDATKRAETGQMVRAIAQHSACTPGYSHYVVELENINFGFYDKVMQASQSIQNLCAQPMPAKAQKLEELPPLFVKMIEFDPKAAAPLRDLWEVYQTHIDMLHAFPVDSPDTPLTLLRWMRAQAKAGSHYAPEKLAQHEDFFKNLSLD
jgi:hypothetical protein